MIPRRITNANVTFTAPSDWDEKTQGKCVPLSARVSATPEGRIVEAAWEPTPEELAALNAGGSVVLQIIGGQPPVWIYAVPPAETLEDA